MSTSQAVRHATSAPSDIELDIGNVDERLEEEMRRLAAINQELLGGIRPGSDDAVDVSGGSDESAALRKENVELRSRVEHLEQALAAAGSGDGSWLEQQKEFEALLEEKSEVIRSLHVKIQELQERGGAVSAPSEEDSGEVQTLRQKMEEQRRQLEEDEEVLMKQMREMEMAMSKDRAELARQRNEIQRLHNELNHEIETASRDGGLRDRLGALQKLQSELTGRKQTPLPGTNPKLAKPEVTEEPVKKKSSGLLGRIFGK